VKESRNEINAFMFPLINAFTPEAYMDEQGTPGQTQAEKGGLERMETRTGSLGGIQRNYPSSQGAS